MQTFGPTKYMKYAGQKWVSTDIINYPQSTSTINKIEANISLLKIKKAIFNIGTTKAQGKDGLPTLFCHNNWDHIGPILIKFVHKVFKGRKPIKEVNQILIALIPKVKKSEFASQFRLISLCNVSYKAVLKTIANRITLVLTSLISPFQASFIPRRKIHDNILIANEILHSMKKSRGRKRFIVIKVDLEEAYNKLKWSFIKVVLEKINLPRNLIRIIMECVILVSLKVLWNGNQSESFLPSRGICMDVLSHIITNLVDKREWKAFKVGRNGPYISHLFFINDIILFGKALVH